jgi:hypothetical protein
VPSDISVSRMMEEDAVPSNAAAFKSYIVGVVNEWRDEAAKIKDLEEELDRLKRNNDQREKTIIERFEDVGIDHMSFPARGNLPGLVVKIVNSYHASIPSSWEPDRQNHGFEVLEDKGLGSIIKNTVSAQFSRSAPEKAREAMKTLEQTGVSASLSQTVHARTLTASLKESIERGIEWTEAEMNAIGAYVRRAVKLIEREE